MKKRCNFFQLYFSVALVLEQKVSIFFQYLLRGRVRGAIFRRIFEKVGERLKKIFFSFKIAIFQKNDNRPEVDCPLLRGQQVLYNCFGIIGSIAFKK